MCSVNETWANSTFNLRVWGIYKSHPNVMAQKPASLVKFHFIPFSLFSWRSPSPLPRADWEDRLSPLCLVL